MKRVLYPLLGVSLILLFSAIVLNRIHSVSAATATNLVISEVQINGSEAGTSAQDFIELYNPTSLDVSLDGMRLGKRTSGTTSANIVIFASEDVVPAHGYFLWCNTSLNVSLSCDSSGSGTIANDNSIALINGSLASGTIIDAVSFGTPGTTFGEGTSLTEPAGGTSVERKANSSSTSITMATGGIDEFMGNGEDTDNNSLDFVERTVPGPQKNSSSLEPIETPSATPSLTPTSSPTPSTTPSITPSLTLSPTITSALTPSPTVTMTPIPTTTPSASPTPPFPTPRIIFAGPRFICSIQYRPIVFFNKIIFIPFGHCAYH